jgi:hypothetical protein
MQNISKEHIEYRKQVGFLKGRPIIELKTTGGFYMIVASKDGGFETLGTGPHKVVARHIAKKREGDIEWSELSKADHIEPEHFAFCLPEYEGLTSRMRKLEGSDGE